VLDEGSGRKAHRARKRAIEHAGVARSALVAEEVGHGAERTLVGSLALALVELFVYHVGNQLLSLDLGELDGAGKLALDKQLLLHELGKRVEQRVGPGSQQISDLIVSLEKLLLQLSNRLGVSLLITKVLGVVTADLLGSLREDLVDFVNQLVEA